MRVPIIAGNWKMNKTVPKAVALIQELVPLVAHSKGGNCRLSALTALYPVGRELSGTNIVLGAQTYFGLIKERIPGNLSRHAGGFRSVMLSLGHLNAAFTKRNR